MCGLALCALNTVPRGSAHHAHIRLSPSLLFLLPGCYVKDLFFQELLEI